MNARHLMLMGTVVAASMVMSSCQQEPYIVTNQELYTRSFIKEFGLINPNQDWNLAKSTSVTVDLGKKKASSVKVYAKVGLKYYLVADLHDVSGEITIPVDVPETTSDLKVKVDKNVYYTQLGLRLDATNRTLSRAEDDQQAQVTIPVADAPGYWEMNAQDAIRFLDNLQEMHYNRDNAQVAKDFLITSTGEPIIVYPIFYNSSQTHTLGVYYFTTDDEDEENVSTIVKVPIYTDKESKTPTGAQHLMMQDFEEVTEYKINNLNLFGGGSGAYSFGWGTSTSTYTLSAKQKSVGHYDFKFENGQAVANSPGDSYEAPAWMLAAVNQYLSDKNLTSINTNDMLSPDHEVYSYIANAAKEALKPEGAETNPNNYCVSELQNWSNTNYINFSLNEVYLSKGDASDGLFAVVLDYMDSKGWSNYSSLSYGDAALVAAINAYLAPYSELTSVTVTNSLSVSLGISTSGPVNTNSAPGGVFECITDALAAASATDYDGIVMNTALMSQIESALKSANGDNYTFAGWSSDGTSATLNYTYSGTLQVYDTPGTYSYDMKSKIAEYVNSGKSFLDLEHDQRFLADLQTVLRNYDTNPNHYATFPVSGYIEGSSFHPTAEIRVFNYSDENWIGVKSAIGTSGMRVYKDGSIAQENKEFGSNTPNTAYNLSYLGKLRSYGISVTIPAGKRFGFYIQTDGGAIYYSEVKGNKDRVVNQGGTIPDWATDEDYIYGAIYEENIDNIKDQDGNPVTDKISYVCFEDWATGSKDDAGRVESDADLNDLVVAVSGLNLERQLIDKSVITSTSTDNSELGWLIAAEDLGSVDDFDFNDVIFKISCITTNDTSSKTEDEGDGSTPVTTTKVTLTKKLTVKALAAGGTLETYLHFNDGTTDYILGPNKIVENTSGASVSDCEWHRWFGSTNTGSMINTGINTVTTPGVCTIAEASGEATSTTGTPTPGLTITSGSKVSLDYLRNFSMEKYFNNAGNTGQIEGFYITVGTSAPGSQVSSQINDDDERMIAPANIGDAPQMFLIPDVGHKTSTKGWYWPTERTHILLAYPQFKEWINDASHTDWHMPDTEPAHITRPTQY